MMTVQVSLNPDVHRSRAARVEPWVPLEQGFAWPHITGATLDPGSQSDGSASQRPEHTAPHPSQDYPSAPICQ
jgi:hypothetical protein